jgi:opacity protein-like surface antigen
LRRGSHWWKQQFGSICQLRARTSLTSLGKNAKLFGGLNAAFGSSKEEDVSVSATAFGVEAGAAFFLNQSIALEAGLGYNSLKIQDSDDPTNTIGLRVGFQIHLGK